ncbi:MAG: hypothetical protein QOG10_4383 [Kribbellaceae bacterium]|nr:hypothetical protein [Kribbellaceae bacterium]
MTSQDPHQPRMTRRMRAAVLVAAAITLVSMLAVVLAVTFIGGGTDSGQQASPLFTNPTSPGPSATPAVSPTSTTPVPTASSVPTTLRSFRYQPLWPFASEAAAAAWQRSYRADGHQSWHLDAEQTALSFTTGYLGFTEIDKVVSRSIRGDDAHVTVGYQAGESPLGVAAVLHLVRIGGGSDAPWEVVGTADTTLTVDRPTYGATVASPLTVGGRISGVDESIRIEVRQPSSAAPIGNYCCVTAGGDRQPWSARVSFRGATDPALMIVASTGGHLQDVEIFAITGIRPATG